VGWRGIIVGFAHLKNVCGGPDKDRVDAFRRHPERALDLVTHHNINALSYLHTNLTLMFGPSYHHSESEAALALQTPTENSYSEVFERSPAYLAILRPGLHSNMLSPGRSTNECSKPRQQLSKLVLVDQEIENGG
jgi:hypothetical protein